jgi:uncharacterized protein (DUF2236 family)
LILGRDDLERRLERLTAAIAEPRLGLHGPTSVSWRFNRETWNFIGGGRAALLQLAHPYVAHAIDQHSTTAGDAQARFRRTFANIFAMTFGDLDQALRAARRVHAIHGRVAGILDEKVGGLDRGHGYRANDVDALIWVHATLIDSVLVVRRLAFGEPAAGEVERYYQESRRFAALFGIPDGALPPDAEAFARYVDATLRSGSIEVGRAARDTARLLLSSEHPLLSPAFALYRRITAVLLPADLAAAFELPDGMADRAVARAALRTLGAVWPRLPRQLRFLPAYLEAQARIGAQPGGPIGRAADRLAMTGFGIWPRPTR